MSEVSVSAVLVELHDRVYGEYAASGGRDLTGTDLIARGEEAIAIVAELIAADREYDAAEAELVAAHKTLFKRDRDYADRMTVIERRCDAAEQRRAAILARIKD